VGELPNPVFEPSPSWHRINPTLDITKQTLCFESDIAGRISREIVNFKEARVRAALDALGWISPEKARDMRDAIKEAHKTLSELSTWRDDCDAYDEGMGYPQRDYDEKQVEMMEKTALQALAKLRPFTHP